MSRRDYEAEARADKVHSVVCWLDTRAQSAGLDLSLERVASATAERLRSATAAEWRDLAAAAGVRPLSATSQRDVVREYEIRAAMIAEPGAVSVTTERRVA